LLPPAPSSPKQVAGKDATEAFAAFDHSDEAWEDLAKLRVGRLVEPDQASPSQEAPATPKQITVLHASDGNGTACRLAHKLTARAKREFGCEATTGPVSGYDLDDLPTEELVIFLVETNPEGGPPPGSEPFFTWLRDIAYDERIDKHHLQGVKFGVFGVGDKAKGEHDNAMAVQTCEWILKRHATQLAATLGDATSDIEVDFASFCENLLEQASLGKKEGCGCTGGAVQEGLEKAEESEEETPREVPYHEVQEEDAAVLATRDWRAISLQQDDEEGYSSDEAAEDVEASPAQAPLMDLEDMGNMIQKQREDTAAPGAKEMLTDPLRKALTKQGYKLVGSHSGVKLCRWTKSMLRGRGGCYKHTFYGIASHRCMEATPSLACANKCVFCWRHHKNPVGREWRWAVDAPEKIMSEALAFHVKMIREFKGVPGVIPARFQEGLEPRHCALSLVGEPIIYPHINRLMEMLHERRISTFMVTNAQIPDKIESLRPVTQLYVSIDGATKESLQEIDRPLFKDFWERFLACLDALSRKGQRTVYRLTLVKGMNVTQIDEYAALVARGRPDFIEIKGVTYCGTSNSGDESELTMQNVPWHEEVVQFGHALCEKVAEIHNNGQGEEYALATEHAHSCCICLAKTRFKIDDLGTGEPRWHTWIDYDKFYDLANSGEKFNAMDYLAPTPDWAVFGAPEGGFAPYETRHARKGSKANEPDPGGC